MKNQARKTFALFLATVLFCIQFSVLSIIANAAVTLYWPVPGHRALSQGFHSGSSIDISDGSINGARVISAIGGTVTHKFNCATQHYGSLGDCNGFGTGLVICGTDGRIYQYAHMQGGSIPSSISVGSTISAGQEIGKVGTTGYSTGSHLHFGISLGNYWNNSGINPINETYIYGSATYAFAFPTKATYANKYSVTNTNAVLVNQVSYSGSTLSNVTKVGIYLYNASGSQLGTKSESVSSDFKAATTGYMFYNVNSELNYTLSPGTLYKYKFFVIAGGINYYSNMYSFTTTGTHTLTNISVKTKPVKLSYYVGDTLDTTGLELTSVYSDLTSASITSGFTCNPTTFNSTGNQTVTVNYGGKRCSFDVTVTDVSLLSVSIKSNPTKLTYLVGDTLDTSGLVLNASYNNGTKKTVSVGFTCNQTTLNTVGTQLITVTYNNKSCTFSIKVDRYCINHVDDNDNGECDRCGASLVTVVSQINTEFAYETDRNVFVILDVTAQKMTQLDEVLKVIDRNRREVRNTDKLSTGMAIVKTDGTETMVVVAGDVDGDALISSADARLALRASVGLEKYSTNSPAFIASDVDNDIRISSADARLILRASVGMENTKAWIRK